MESTAYTIKEINAVTSCSVFSTALICQPYVAYKVLDVLSRAFINTDFLFYASTSVQGTGAQHLQD